MTTAPKHLRTDDDVRLAELEDTTRGHEERLAHLDGGPDRSGGSADAAALAAIEALEGLRTVIGAVEYLQVVQSHLLTACEGVSQADRERHLIAAGQPFYRASLDLVRARSRLAAVLEATEPEAEQGDLAHDGTPADASAEA